MVQARAGAWMLKNILRIPSENSVLCSLAGEKDDVPHPGGF